MPAVKPNLSEFQLDPQCNEILNWIYRSFPWNLSTNHLSPLAANENKEEVLNPQNLFGAENTSERYSHHEYSELLKNLCSLSLNALPLQDSETLTGNSESTNKRPMSSQPITTQQLTFDQPMTIQHFNFDQPIRSPVDNGPQDIANTVSKTPPRARPTELTHLAQQSSNASKKADRNPPTNQGSEHESCSNEEW